MTLTELGRRHKTDKADEHGYTPIYEKYFGDMRLVKFALVEIGVQFGCSIKMWQDFFVKADIYGVDIVNNFTSDNPRVHLITADGTQPEFLKSIPESVDIVIDDGSHIGSDQKRTFDLLWPRLSKGGFFVIEDTATWWDAHFNLTVPSLLASIIGSLNKHGREYHGKPSPPEALSPMDTQIEFVHCYRGLIIIRKKS